MLVLFHLFTNKRPIFKGKYVEVQHCELNNSPIASLIGSTHVSKTYNCKLHLKFCVFLFNCLVYYQYI